MNEKRNDEGRPFTSNVSEFGSRAKRQRRQFDLASTVRPTVLHNSATNDKLIARHSVLEMHQYHLGHGIHSNGTVSDKGL